MQRRDLLKAGLAVPALAPAMLAHPALAQGLTSPGVAPAATRARTLRFVPQAALTVLDPIFLLSLIHI